MALLAEDYLIAAIERGRCVRSDVPLAPDEHLLSRRAAAFLYDGSLELKDPTAVVFCEALFKSLPLLMKKAPSPEVRRAVLGFCSSLIKHPMLAREEFVHWSIFEFWDDIWRNAEERIPLSERYYEGAALTASAEGTKFGREVLPRLRGADDAYPDIVGLGGRASRELVLVEIKLEGIDDRAIGQVLRYYQLGRAVCDGGGLTCDIRGVLPVLVVKDVRKLAFWEAFPLHFREFLQVLTYNVNARGMLEIVDCRRALAAQTRQRSVYRG